MAGVAVVVLGDEAGIVLEHLAPAVVLLLRAMPPPKLVHKGIILVIPCIQAADSAWLALNARQTHPPRLYVGLLIHVTKRLGVCLSSGLCLSISIMSDDIIHGSTCDWVHQGWMTSSATSSTWCEGMGAWLHMIIVQDSVYAQGYSMSSAAM